jgi:hypothetical protein
VKLPACKENDEQMVRIPEPFKVRTTSFFQGEKDHDKETGRHDPARNARTRGEIGDQKIGKACAESLCIGVKHGKAPEVDHMCKDMDDSADYDGPRCSLVKCDIFIEWDDAVERCSTKKRDEVPAHGNKNEDDIDVKNESGGTGKGKGYAKVGARNGETVSQLVVDETEDGHQQMKEDPDEKEQALSTFIDHPDVEFLTPSVGYVWTGRSVGPHLQALQPPTFGFIALQMNRRGVIAWRWSSI